MKYEISLGISAKSFSFATIFIDSIFLVILYRVDRQLPTTFNKLTIAVCQNSKRRCQTPKI